MNLKEKKSFYIALTGSIVLTTLMVVVSGHKFGLELVLETLLCVFGTTAIAVLAANEIDEKKHTFDLLHAVTGVIVLCFFFFELAKEFG